MREVLNFIMFTSMLVPFMILSYAALNGMNANDMMGTYLDFPFGGWKEAIKLYVTFWIGTLPFTVGLFFLVGLYSFSKNKTDP